MGAKSGERATVRTPAFLMASSSFLGSEEPQAARESIMARARRTLMSFKVFFIVMYLSKIIFKNPAAELFVIGSVLHWQSFVNPFMKKYAEIFLYYSL